MTIAIVLLTKNRLDYAARTLRAVLHNAASNQPIHVHIADDGSDDPEAHVGKLLQIAEDLRLDYETAPTSTQTGGHSYGRSYNLAMQVVHEFAEYVLPLEDDWELTEHLDLDRLVTMLQDPEVGCVRLGYLGWTQPLFGKLHSAGGCVGLLLDPLSPERHVFAGHPRLETREWERAVGPWPEGLGAGTTEFEVAGRPHAREGVFWPFLSPDIFAHIGTVQAREDQR